MSHANLVLLILIGVLCSTIMAKISCGRNKVWSECGTLCQPTCRKPYVAPCYERICLRGCQCKKGYVLFASGNCIHASVCDQMRRFPQLFPQFIGFIRK